MTRIMKAVETDLIHEELEAPSEKRGKKCIILLKGKARHGKDSVAEYLHDRYGFWRVSHAELLKRIARLMGWDGRKDDGDGRGRKFLQHMGDVCREYNPLMLVEYVLGRMQMAGWPDRVVLSDCRFPNEVDRYRMDDMRRLGYETVLVEVVRPGLDADSVLGENALHKSETALDGVPADLVLVNNGETLEALMEKVDEILCSGTLRIEPAVSGDLHTKVIPAETADTFLSGDGQVRRGVENARALGKTIVTLDFDDTLCEKTGIFEKKRLAFYRMLAEHPDICIYVVTGRSDKDPKLGQIEEYLLSNGLRGISGIIYGKGDKTEILRTIDPIRHEDDVFDHADDFVKAGVPFVIMGEFLSPEFVNGPWSEEMKKRGGIEADYAILKQQALEHPIGSDGNKVLQRVEILQKTEEDLAGPER